MGMVDGNATEKAVWERLESMMEEGQAGGLQETGAFLPQAAKAEFNEALAFLLKTECRDIISETVRNVFAPVAEMEMISKKEFLTEREVETLFSIPVGTLRTERCRNKGPRYIKEGRKVLYPRKEVTDHYLSSLVKIRK